MTASNCLMEASLKPHRESSCKQFHQCNLVLRLHTVLVRRMSSVPNSEVRSFGEQSFTIKHTITQPPACASEEFTFCNHFHAAS